MSTKPAFNRLLTRLLLSRSARQGGFTLTELLIAIAVGSLIIGSLLFLVVELLQINRREEILTQTQQDMRRAIDYITRDAGEAVHVYSTPGAIVNPATGATLLDQLDNFPQPGETPVLAFWRLDPLDPNNAGVRTLFSRDCSSAAYAGRANECTTLKVRQGYYTLVIYALQANGPNDIWGGPRRIVRYELPKYTSGGIADLTSTPGYAEPTGSTNDFATWRKGAGTTPRNIAVLTDFVDAPATGPGSTPECPAGYLATPGNADSFYACVRLGTRIANPTASGETLGTNQTLIVFLRGNADTGNAGLGTFANAGRLPTLRSEVLIRGVLDKQPGL